MIEIGFCADLRLKAKQMEKTHKYKQLMAELEDRWMHVNFIAVPIGNAGAMLASTKEELARLVSTQPSKKIENARSDQLARTLATVAARRLYGITVEYYRLRRDRRQPRQQDTTPAPVLGKKMRLHAKGEALDNPPAKRPRLRLQEPVQPPEPPSIPPAPSDTTPRAFLPGTKAPLKQPLVKKRAPVGTTRTGTTHRPGAKSRGPARQLHPKDTCYQSLETKPG